MDLVVDAWMQHPTPGFRQHAMFQSIQRWTAGHDGPMAPGREPVEDGRVATAPTVDALTEAGVTVGLLSAWHGPDGPLIPNDYVAASVAEHPDRFRGVAAVDLRRPMDAVRDLRRAVRELGFVALRVIPWLWELPPNDRRYYPLYAECVELGVPFCTQAGHAGPLRGSEPGRPIPYLDDVALDFPDLVIVAGHIGYPWTAEMIALATKYPNVYIDTSAYTVRRYPPELVAYLKGHGRRKVLFGSNYPMITPARALSGLDDLGLDDEARALFLGGNAARVFHGLA